MRANSGVIDVQTSKAVRNADYVPIGSRPMLLLQVAPLDHRRQSGPRSLFGQLPVSDYSRRRFCNANDSTSMAIQGVLGQGRGGHN